MQQLESLIHVDQSSSGKFSIIHSAESLVVAGQLAECMISRSSSASPF